MEKHMEENFNNPDREDEIRLNKNDIHKKKKTSRGFVAQDQIPTIEDQDPFSSTQNLEKEGDSEYIENEEFDYDEEKQMEERRIEQLKKQLKLQQSDGAVSVSMEDPADERPAHVQHRGAFWFDAEKTKKEEEFIGIERDVMPRKSRRKTSDAITSMSADQVTRQSRDYDKTRKAIRSQAGKGNTGIEHDNLKTMPEHAKTKNWRQKIMDFFSKQNYEESKPIDKSFTKEEGGRDIAA